MNKQKMLVTDCETGMILAEDIICNGLKLAAKNTVLNSYIIDKLIAIGEYNIYMYVPECDTPSYKSNVNIIDKFKVDYDINLKKIKKIINELFKTNKINADKVWEISKSVITYFDEPNVIIECLSSLKEADEYTYTHCINVAIYSMLIGKWMNLTSENVIEVVQGGLLHDVGKTRVDNEILNKADKLTNEEFEEMKKHTIFGYEVVNQYNNFNENIKYSILMHHERIDGSGYPLGRNAKDITLGAKIISVADTFDAMTSNRVYQKGVTPFKAFQMFLTEGIKLYDTSVIFTFLENISVYYIGMKVFLDDGRSGEIVYIPPNQVLNPIIKIGDEFIDFSKERDLNIISISV